MRSLYPEIEPYVNHSLEVEPPHCLHVEECGNPDGLPVVFVHGGPGSGCEDYHRRFFDPDRYRVVLFDQRGCGRSTPHAALEGNTTQALVADMEAVRRRLGIDRWLVFGGSWGSTLGLAYAEAHPERVAGLVLRGIMLARLHEIHWFYQRGANRVLPDHWEDFAAPIPEAEHDDMVAAYYRRLTGDNEVDRMAAAKAWSLWEGRAATLRPSAAVEGHYGNPYVALSLARIECHYFMNDCFLEPDQLLAGADRLAGIPGVIVHGRYDLICPLENAWQLHRAWPDSELRVVQEAGHAASEPGIIDALVRATDAFADRLA